MQHMINHSNLQILGLAPMADLESCKVCRQCLYTTQLCEWNGIAINNTSTWMLQMMCAPLEPEDVMFKMDISVHKLSPTNQMYTELCIHDPSSMSFLDSNRHRTQM